MSKIKETINRARGPEEVKFALNLRGSDSETDTSSFGGILSSADDTVQKALDTIDDIFGSDVTVSGNITASGGNIEAISTDAGATAGPTLDTYRNSASPAVNDRIGELNFFGNDSAANKELYAAFRTQVFDVTSGTEDAAFTIFVVRGGSFAERMRVGSGVNVGSPTGGFQGQGALNASEIYDDGVQIKPVEVFRSSGQSITASTAHTFAHGLSAEPDTVMVLIENTSAELNYSVGDRVIISNHFEDQGATTDKHQGVSVQVDATNVTVRVTEELIVADKTSTAPTPITVGSWDMYVKAIYHT